MSIAQHSVGLVGLAFLSGVCFSLIGIAYRIGQSRGVRPSQIAIVISLAGTAVFGLRCRGLALSSVPAWVWIVGLAGGAGQYATMVLIRRALARGALTATWCAVSLYFLPVIVYARFAFDERISPLRYLGVAAGIVCVLVASLSRREASATPMAPGSGRAGYVAYAAVLLGILLCNGLLGMGMKDLRMRPTGSTGSYMSRFGDFYYALWYATLGLLVCMEMLRHGRLGVPLGRLVAVAAPGVCGSVVGAWALGTSAALPAALVFTISGVVSILTAALASVAALGEKPTRLWYATVGLAVLAIVLVQVGESS